MERITISIEADLLAQLDGLMERKSYRTRSEALRDILRRQLTEDRLETGGASHGVGCLSYVFNHHERELSRRLTQAQHDHHDLGLSTLHVHLDHDHCLEATILHGPLDRVRRFADAVMAERGVRHGNLNLVPVDVAVERHDPHGHSHGREAHTHSHPKT